MAACSVYVLNRLQDFLLFVVVHARWFNAAPPTAAATPRHATQHQQQTSQRVETNLEDPSKYASHAALPRVLLVKQQNGKQAEPAVHTTTGARLCVGMVSLICAALFVQHLVD